MASISDNRNHWNDPRNWSSGGHEWSSDWGTTEGLWQMTLQPRLKKHLSGGLLDIVEIAPGHGRVTRFLLPYARRFIGVDLAPTCVEICRERYADHRAASFVVNDGKSLPTIADSSVDLVFSFDSLVHVDRPAMQAYVAEVARVLRPGGAAFLHHSNLETFAAEQQRQRALARASNFVPFGRRALRKAGIIGWDNGRDPTMSAGQMATFAQANGLGCDQELINWGGARLIDCISTLTKPRAGETAVYTIRENFDFMAEARRAKRVVATK